jgi:hypothetical protein
MSCFEVAFGLAFRKARTVCLSGKLMARAIAGFAKVGLW